MNSTSSLISICRGEGDTQKKQTSKGENEYAGHNEISCRNPNQVLKIVTSWLIILINLHNNFEAAVEVEKT